jgi:hypothetical protein
VWGWTDAGTLERRLTAIAIGKWAVHDREIPELAGCLDIDLKSSACTNRMPVRRLDLDVGEATAAPAVYIRAHGLGVERLEQDYCRIGGEGDRRRFRYRAPAFDGEELLVYDRCGLVLDYPGIAARVG